ncbi:MAG: hypothetical protein AAF570_21175, partial [Bacteroidota bacterium]
DKAWAYEGKNAVMLEYAWDISSQQPVKCDPCVTQPITFNELREAGVWWISPTGGWGGYQGDLFVTRLHARYSSDLFPQDLMFINTPNSTHFQGRYVIHNPASGPMDCSEAKKYQKTLKMRKQREMLELAALTGWKTSKYSWYLTHNQEPEDFTVPQLIPDPGPVLIGKKNPNNLPRPDRTKLKTPRPTIPTTDISTPTPNATDLTAEDPETIVLNDEDIEISSEDFLAEAVAASTAAPSSPNGILFAVAMGMFAIGLIYRRHLRRSEEV